MSDPTDQLDAQSTTTVMAYKVEVRIDPTSYSSPMNIGRQILDDKWRPLAYDRAPIGVPPLRLSPHLTDRYGLLSFASASALAWWALASIDCMSAECRLVKYTATTSTVIHREGEAVMIHTDWRLRD